MPPTIPPQNQWLAQQFAQIKADIAALKSGRTQYSVDANGVCQAIYGDITHDHKGNPTGLSGWGIASFKTGSWVQM